MIQCKKMQVKHKKVVIEHKKNSWEKTATGLTINTPIAKLWEAVRGKKGRLPQRITILDDWGVAYGANEDFSNKVAVTFADISRSNNFTRTFTEVTEKRERERIELKTSRKT